MIYKHYLLYIFVYGKWVYDLSKVYIFREYMTKCVVIYEENMTLNPIPFPKMRKVRKCKKCNFTFFAL